MWGGTELRLPRESQGGQAGPELWAGRDARGGGCLSCVLQQCVKWEGMEGVVQAELFDLSFNTAPEFMLDWDGDGLRLQSFPA